MPAPCTAPSCLQYYPLDISFFKSSLDSHLLDLLWNKYWVHSLSSNPLLNTRDLLAGQLADIGGWLGCAGLGWHWWLVAGGLVLGRGASHDAGGCCTHCRRAGAGAGSTGVGLASLSAIPFPPMQIPHAAAPLPLPCARPCPCAGCRQEAGGS